MILFEFGIKYTCNSRITNFTGSLSSYKDVLFHFLRGFEVASALVEKAMHVAGRIQSVHSSQLHENKNEIDGVMFTGTSPKQWAQHFSVSGQHKASSVG